MPVTAALIGAGATLLTNRAAGQRSREAMAFEARQSSTSHQREVKDLRLAGLNPILSGTGGSGASTASGKVPVVENPTNSALAVTRLQQEIKNMQATEANIKEQTTQIQGGVVAKQGGTDLYNKARDSLTILTNPKPASAKQINKKQSNFNLKRFEQTTPQAEQRIQKLLRKNNKYQ